jgi:hypothetical protein
MPNLSSEPRGTLELIEVRIARSDLAKMPKETLSAFLTFGTIFNEIYMLRKLVLMSDRYAAASTDSIPVSNAQAVQTVFFLKLMALKTKEGFRYLWRQQKKPWFIEVFKEIPPDSISQYDALKAYFDNKENPISLVRDASGGHYDDKQPLDVGNLGDEFETRIYLSKEVGNSVFFASEELLFTKLMKEVYPELDLRAAFDLFFTELNLRSKELCSILHDCISEMTKRIWDAPPKQQSNVFVKFPKISETVLPYFVNVRET